MFSNKTPIGFCDRLEKIAQNQIYPTIQPGYYFGKRCFISGNDVVLVNDDKCITVVGSRTDKLYQKGFGTGMFPYILIAQIGDQYCHEVTVDEDHKTTKMLIAEWKGPRLAEYDEWK